MSAHMLLLHIFRLPRHDAIDLNFSLLLPQSKYHENSLRIGAVRNSPYFHVC